MKKISLFFVPNLIIIPKTLTFIKVKLGENVGSKILKSRYKILTATQIKLFLFYLGFNGLNKNGPFDTSVVSFGN
jgi:hypothetical protein